MRVSLATVQPATTSRRVRTSAVIVSLAVGAAAAVILWRRVPSSEIALPHAPDRPALVTGGRVFDLPARFAEDTLLVPAAFLAELSDGAVAWDPASGTVIATTAEAVVRMRTGELTAYINQRPVSLSIAPVMVEDAPYVPVEPIARLLALDVSRGDTGGTVAVDRADVPFQTAEAVERTALRTRPTIKAPIVEALEPFDTVYVFGESNGWYLARRGSGMPGYVPKESTCLKGLTTVPKQSVEYYQAWKRTGERICMVWEHVLGNSPVPSKIGPLPGVNVVSPTWLRLSEKSGTITCRADPAYVNWAHQRGYEVWALLDNGFDPKLTAEFLNNPAARENAARAILLYSELYGLDGINLDFENMDQRDARTFAQFVRELVPLCHEQGLTVSVDVTVKSPSPNWSLCYDRKALGESADYVILMAYDEFSSASRKPGPVSSLPWTDKGIRTLLEEVPPSKVVLGIPFYSRLWREENGGSQVTSRALSMDDAAAFLRQAQVEPIWDESLKLHVARFDQGGSRYSIWLEDFRSLGERVALVKRYGLRGIAAWRRGFESVTTWATLQELMKY
ncbi:MAG: glycosyl hydrolase family 18 protein [Firmicutes bacterium]|nr:glycosyl hydrolase family 18 protein [Bacillota bacterium]